MYLQQATLSCICRGRSRRHLRTLTCHAGARARGRLPLPGSSSTWLRRRTHAPAQMRTLIRRGATGRGGAGNGQRGGCATGELVQGHARENPAACAPIGPRGWRSGSRLVEGARTRRGRGGGGGGGCITAWRARHVIAVNVASSPRLPSRSPLLCQD